jgi:UDPglucose 6-dehydrogenase
MNITIFGTGYVGLVTGICLADLGNQVVCVDIDVEKIASLQKGIATIFEPGIESLLQHNLSAGRIRFTTDLDVGVQHGLFQFIAVGTPADDDGAADLGAVHAVARSLGEKMKNYCLIITKSTVPVGTADQIRTIIEQSLAHRNVAIDFDIASNPEFLREGAAITDFMNPDRIIVGTDNMRALDYLRELYMPFIDSGKRFIAMNTRSSELTKYFSNAFLATKISFMNEMSHLAEKLDADIEDIRKGMSLDPRIGEHFLFPGCGYGGSCFPKDVQALQRTAQNFGYELQLLLATEKINQNQKRLLFKKLQQFFNHDLQGKVIALWGLAFKPNTDDMREASSRILIEDLWSMGARVQAYDPVAMSEAKRIYGECDNFTLCPSPELALENADVLTIVTEWDIFRSPNFDLMKQKLRYPAIFDGRNLYDPIRVAEHGFKYFAIGRGESI